MAVIIKKLLVVFFVVFAVNCFAAPVSSGVFDEGKYAVYIPGGLDDSYVYPLIIGFSAGGNGMEVINTWKSAAEDNNCIIFASNVIKNGMDIQKELVKVKADIIGELSIKYPADLNKIITLGSSGGGMAAHLFSFLHPVFISGVISNVGYIHESSLKQSKKYPVGKVCGFLASPTDFNYKLMREDLKFLNNHNWKCKWIEFEGGHKMAPEADRFEVLEFVLSNLE